MIQISKPSLGIEEIKAVQDIFESGWLGMGSKVIEFENELKNILGVNNVIAVNTGTSAIHITLDALNIKAGDEVIVPSLTFVGSIQPILACHSKPVFCDINSDTLNIDVKDMIKKITRKTRVIMPVHFGGLPCEMDEILKIAKKNKIIVVEDAAHAFGSTYKGRKIGSFGDITCFSFDPIKNITCGEGGAVATNNNRIAEIIRRKRILGISKDTWNRRKNEKGWYYEVTTSGYRYHMSNINAAIGLIQIKKLDNFISRKKEIVKIYDNEFKKVHEITLLYRNYQEIAPFIYIIKVKNNRDKLINYLRDKGIEAGVNYIPNHLQPFFKKYSIKLPITNIVWKQIISLPLYYDMTNTDIEYVIKNVKKYFKK